MWFRFVGRILFVLPFAAEVARKHANRNLPSFPTFNTVLGEEDRC